MFSSSRPHESTTRVACVDPAMLLMISLPVSSADDPTSPSGIECFNCLDLTSLSTEGSSINPSTVRKFALKLRVAHHTPLSLETVFR